MSYQEVPLSFLCSVMTGVPINRAKKAAEDGKGTERRILVARSMQDGRIIEDELALEVVSGVKPQFFTEEGDVILKLSTPYDSVYVDKAYEGILVTSFAVILRAKQDSKLDMRYLTVFLNHPRTTSQMQLLGSGSIMPILKKSAVAEIPIPIAPMVQQISIANMYCNTQARKEACRQLMATSNLLLESAFINAVYPINN